MNRLKQYSGELSIVLATVFWGCISLYSRNMNAAGFTTVQTVAVRAVITAVILGVFMLVKDPKLLRIRLRDLWMFLGSGICSFLFFNICYMNSIAENSVSVACVLMYTSPFWILLLSVPIFKEKVTWQNIVSLVIALVGCVLLCTAEELKLTRIGLVYGLLSGFGYALYSIFGKLAAKQYSTVTITFYTFLFAAIAIVPFSDLPALGTLLQTPSNVALSIGIAATNTIIPYMLYTYGLSKVAAGKASILSISEPVVATLVGVFAFGELLKLGGMLGISLVVIGLVVLQYKPKHK
ncbi:MAG: EamA family transporter [Clostridia bacterium]|nr:EamA family transporter [Clostridia bacterium]